MMRGCLDPQQLCSCSGLGLFVELMAWIFLFATVCLSEAATVGLIIVVLLDHIVFELRSESPNSLEDELNGSTVLEHAHCRLYDSVTL